MATNKNRVNAYIDDKAFKAFDVFCQKWQVSYSRGVELLIHKYLLGDLGSAESTLDLTPTQLEEITAKVKSNLGEVISNALNSKIEEVKSDLDSAISNVLVRKLPLDKFNKAIALVDEYEELQGKLETLAGHNREMEAELMAVRENIERLTQQYKEEEVEYTTYPEDAIKLLEEEEATETEKPKEEVTDKVQSLSAGTQLKGTEKDNY